MPRQKITAAQLPGADLPDLTAQQQKFVEGLLAGKTGADAYRAAYDCSNMLGSTVIEAASRLRANAKIAAMLSAARQAGLGTAVLTYDSHLRELERLREIALDSGNIGAAVQAEQLRGKVAGHHVEQVRDVTSQHDSAATIRQLAELTGADPFAIAAKYGVSLPDEGATKH